MDTDTPGKMRVQSGGQLTLFRDEARVSMSVRSECMHCCTANEFQVGVKIVHTYRSKHLVSNQELQSFNAH